MSRLSIRFRLSSALPRSSSARSCSAAASTEKNKGSSMADPVAVNNPVTSPGQPDLSERKLAEYLAEQPAGDFSFTQLIPTLVVDVAMPIIAFNVLTHYGVSTLLALVAGGLFPALNNLRVWITARRLE